MNLQNKIYTCRKKLGLSQEKLAEEIGVSRQAISKWETGEAVPEVSKVIALCKTFGVSSDWLLNDDLEPEDLPSEVPDEETPDQDTPENTPEEAAEANSEQAEAEAACEETCEVSADADIDTVADTDSEEPIAVDYEFVGDESDTDSAEEAPTGGFRNLISFKIYKYFGRLGFVILGFAMYALMAYGIYFYNKGCYNFYGIKAVVLACYGFGVLAIGLAGIIASAVMLIASFVHSRKLSTKERVEIVDSRHARFKKYYKSVENKLGFIGAGVILFAASLIMSVGVLFAYNYAFSRSLVVAVGLIFMGLATLMVLYSAILFYRVYHAKAVKKQDK